MRSISRWSATFSHPRTTVVLAALCGLVAIPLGARALSYDGYRCHAASMVPTIWPGEDFLAERAGEIHRGDVVIFRYPDDTRTAVVKRVIAGGGDMLQVHEGRVELNGAQLPRCEVGELEGSDEGTLYVEALGDRRYLTAELDGLDRGEYCVDAPCRVPDGEIFVLGDNRDDSFDGRFWGSIPLWRVIGVDPEGARVPGALNDRYARCLADLRSIR